MKSKRKIIYLGLGTEKDWKWSLSINVLPKQPNWEGAFYFQETTKCHTQKTIHLTSGTEEGWGWQLAINLSAGEQLNWFGSFSLANETRKYRTDRRAEDRVWVEKTFPRRWRQQFELHHNWLGGETCYFLTPEQHRARDKETQYGPQNQIVFGEGSAAPPTALHTTSWRFGDMPLVMLRRSTPKLTKKKLVRLRHRDKRYKRYIRRTERYQCYKLLSSFADYYEKKQIGIPPYIEEESISVSEKERLKRNAKIKEGLILRALIQDERKTLKYKIGEPKKKKKKWL